MSHDRCKFKENYFILCLLIMFLNVTTFKPASNELVKDWPASLEGITKWVFSQWFKTLKGILANS